MDFTALIFPILNAIDHRSSTLSNVMDLCSFSCSPELLQIKKTLFNEVCCCGRTFLYISRTQVYLVLRRDW